MDAELVEYLETRLNAMEARLNDGIQRAKDESIVSSRSELRPLVDLIESLSREVHDGFARTDARLEAVQVSREESCGRAHCGPLAWMNGQTRWTT